jgi:hypothetical protein
MTIDAVVGSPPVDIMPSMLNVPNGANQPNNTDRPGLTYDATHNVDVDFGGCRDGISASCGSWSSATWTFNGTLWTQWSPATSPAGPIG